MEKTLNEPILIIKTAWGGRSLLTDFTPPSAPPPEISKRSMDWAIAHNENLEEIKERVAKTPRGEFYHHMIDHVQTSAEGHQAGGAGVRSESGLRVGRQAARLLSSHRRRKPEAGVDPGLAAPVVAVLTLRNHRLIAGIPPGWEPFANSLWWNQPFFSVYFP